MELLLMIIKGLELGDLAALLRTCQRMRTLIENCLYADIDTRVFNKPDGYFMIWRLRGLFRTLKARPDLARSVLSLRGDICPWDGNDYRERRRLNYTGGKTGVLPRLWELWGNWKEEQGDIALEEIIVTGFNNMENLRFLEINDDRRSPRLWTSLLLLKKSRLPSLTSLKFCSTCKASFAEVVSIIGTLPHLEHLELPTYYLKDRGPRRDDWAPLSTDFPRLKSLVGPLQEIRKIVPGRRITSLVLFHGNERQFDPAIWRDLGCSKGPLTRITILLDGHSGPPVTAHLTSVTYNLKHLESLTVESILLYTSYNDVAAGLAPCTQLRHLSIHVGYPSDFPEHDVWDNLTLACPTLERLHVSRRISGF
ncbi:hypothetical protein FRB94_002938 [Tulasnella sp. JGI-2019a]|nr:hypothetical protein FRB93_013144 [Tulasnella sp. JGI-2019a]KAG9013410.1 hypothetical protein FRB94_002938 [Tulasnella sp. JGI-2019a]